MINKVFHFTNEYGYKKIFNDRALKPIKNFIPYGVGNLYADDYVDLISLKLPDIAHQSALWGMPLERLNDKPYVDFIKKATAKNGDLYCLEIDLKPTDQAYVFDELPFRGKHGTSEYFQYTPKSPEEIKRLYQSYWETMTCRTQYKEGLYKEAEVVFFDPIPVSQIVNVTVDKSYNTKSANDNNDWLLDLAFK